MSTAKHLPNLTLWSGRTHCNAQHTFVFFKGEWEVPHILYLECSPPTNQAGEVQKIPKQSVIPTVHLSDAEISLYLLCNHLQQTLIYRKVQSQHHLASALAQTPHRLG